MLRHREFGSATRTTFSIFCRNGKMGRKAVRRDYSIFGTDLWRTASIESVQVEMRGGGVNVDAIISQIGRQMQTQQSTASAVIFSNAIRF